MKRVITLSLIGLGLLTASCQRYGYGYEGRTIDPHYPQNEGAELQKAEQLEKAQCSEDSPCP